MEHEGPMTWPGTPMPEPRTQKFPFLPNCAGQHEVHTWSNPKAQAAIDLKVPMSGDPELDAMIRESRRLDMATAAMQGLVVGRASYPIEWADEAVVYADALLAASEKEQKK